MPGIPAHSENQRLCELVLKLAVQLDRPICSLDLDAHFHTEPDSRPILTQRLGQLLIKAARPAVGPVPRLRRVGLFGNRAYYANDDPVWNVRFADFVNRGRLELFHELRFPDRVRYLMGSQYGGLASHALAGWVAETELLMARCPDHPLNSDLVRQREQARPLAALTFRLVAHDDLMDRVSARRLLRRLVEHRNPHRCGYKVNYNRYLAPLKWPQSALYPAADGRLDYSRRQLQAYMISR
jgi:hypothetical protein